MKEREEKKEGRERGGEVRKEREGGNGTGRSGGGGD